jgi:hypothetical protein
MVELHYEDQQTNPATGLPEVVHWRIIVNDEEAALAQAAQDVAEGRSPIVMVPHDPQADPWDYAQEYDGRKWRSLWTRGRLQQRARSMGPQVGG